MSEVNPALNVTFDCTAVFPYQLIQYQLEIYGYSLNRVEIVQPIVYSYALRGDATRGTTVRALTEIVYSYALRGTAVIERNRSNWVGWSKIGEASFVLDAVNDAGFRPMDWKGQVFSIKKLATSAVIYGSNGITLMRPVGSPYATFGFRNLMAVGLYSKNSVCGSDTAHHFIDAH